MRFTDKIALITAAPNGIGRATAEIMAREGALVICFPASSAPISLQF
jgi:NAD(P)-dependent dehydrogenase (short-subunit alcohol dehydrogenase family)